ncbi:MAG: hypothetical protein F4013_07385 [Gammaproteobacteria bacterium]|nr:hypothetical protein [Gammaproteobacteria bacterium]MYH32706.1 hypothetical protein [Gammaproteobacteria bacterium]MYL01509.1 hypothetical protein [Gammaproteobacteria bacterium]
MTLFVERIGTGEYRARPRFRSGFPVILALFVAACSQELPSRPAESIDLQQYVEPGWFLRRPGVDSDVPCDGTLQVAECWLMLDNREGCTVWQEEPLAGGATITWSGECKNGRANGEGTLSITWPNNWHPGSESTHEGEIRDGRRTGHWVLRHSFLTEQGEYREGRRIGPWEISGPGGWSITERYMTRGPIFE